MPSKAARTKAKAAKLAQRAAQQNVGPADNPANIAGSSNGPPTSTSFPGLGNMTGSTMATVGFQNLLAVARDEIPSSAQGQVSSVLSLVPSGFTIHSNHGESALPIIPEDERARSDIIGRIINAAIEQLRAPRGADETDDEYQLRQDSLRRLENPGAYATRNISTIVRPALITWWWMLNHRLYHLRQKMLPSFYSINPGVTETAIVMPVAVPNGSASRPNQYERTVRMRRLYWEAGAGHVEIGRNEFHSESTDIESAEEVARIRQLVERRGPGPDDNIPELFDVDSDSTMPINVCNCDLLGRDLLSPDGSITTTSSAHVRRLARITECVNARARLNMEEERALQRAQAEERDRRASQIRGPRPEAPAQITVETDPVSPVAPEAAEAIPVAVPVVPAQTVDAIAAVTVEPIIVAERNPDFPGRVALQRTRFNQLRESGEATVPDQGIGFDLDGNPFERDNNSDNERTAIAAYFLRNNLDPGLAFGPNGRQNVADQGNVPVRNERARETPPHLQRNAAMARDVRMLNPPDSDSGSSYPHTDSGFTDTDESSSHSGLPQGNYPEDRRRQARRRHRANQADRNRRENEQSAHSGGGGDGDDEPTDSGGGSDDSEDTERPESRNGDAPNEEGRRRRR
ncbi:hypothetical protein C8J56DRAFT_902859 [Mycena floridula]|nr:hypothetical protein C8J56DRAFT_902859 [Mycena floridula]